MNTAGVASYGAMELKRFYQKNFTFAILIAAGIHIAAVGSVLLYKLITAQAENALPGGPKRLVIIEPTAPPSMTQTPAQISIAEPDIAPPSIGIPTPVPDEEVAEQVRFPTRAELAKLQSIVPQDFIPGEGDSVVISINTGEYFPAPTEFIAVEEQPVPVRRVQPPYPEIARLTGTEGVTWVQALVDKSGKVRDARVVKPSGSNVGFDEAAVESALRCLYKPAIQNGQPVAVWVTYPVEFKLK